MNLLLGRKLSESGPVPGMDYFMTAVESKYTRARGFYDLWLKERTIHYSPTLNKWATRLSLLSLKKGLDTKCHPFLLSTIPPPF